MLNLLKLLLCQNCFSTKFRKILVTALFSEQLLVTVSKYENNSKMKIYSCAARPYPKSAINYLNKKNWTHKIISVYFSNYFLQYSRVAGNFPVPQRHGLLRHSYEYWKDKRKYFYYIHSLQKHISIDYAIFKHGLDL